MIVQLKTQLKVHHDGGATLYEVGKHVNWSVKRQPDADVHTLWLYDPIMKRQQCHVETTKPRENPSWL